MYNHEPADYDCPLCHIAKSEPVKGEPQESTVIYRTDKVTVFIAGRWWRACPGHVIVISNQHIENIYDMLEEIGHAIFDATKKVAVALKEVYGCEGVSTRQHNEPAGDQDAWHYHMHIFPRNEGDDLYVNHKDNYWTTLEERQPYADKLKAYFSKQK